MERMANQAGRDDTGDMEDLQDSPASPTRGAENDSNSGSGIDGQGGGSGVGDDNEADVVHFSDNNFKDGRVFKLSSGSEKQIEFDRTDDDADLKDIKWHVKTKKNETLGSAKFEDSRPDRQFIDFTNSSVMLNFTGETAQFYGKDMFIQIDWEKNGTTGYTKTELFTVTNSTDDKDINELNDNLEKHQREQKGPLETTMSPGTDSTSSPSSLPSSSSEADGSSNDSSSNGGGGGGLSTGATAGIAVGAVLGALLIGALAWFFLRRHRRNQRAGDDYVTQQTYAVDKETHNRAADSPNSPYSDENHMQPVFLGNLDHDRDAAPTPPPAGVPRSSFGSHDRGNNSGAQTPQGMSRNVAHLVEDGMTADEIRRLEEEERQLDDEIERAARR
ncbi:hypothetical protein BKA59DRAFT_507767 [Fusarium tricinctum]|uniref:Uncharacterized protein n=1 Tax=Fusarium tricinctum TaxID=61284 RepID=A0A8K0S5V0_9HYPO|nr:hypothetical protein BKA59DRAFT_507767 [Fusarium tricinctum]